MLKSKQEFAQTAQGVHAAIRNTGQSIKLGSVRERIAQALGYNSANGLLAELPVECPPAFTYELSLLFQEKHRITWSTTICDFPWPEGIELSKDEINILWQEACTNNPIFAGVNQVAAGAETLGKLRANGRGGWFYTGDFPPFGELVFTGMEKDPNLLFPESLVTAELVAQVIITMTSHQ